MKSSYAGPMSESEVAAVTVSAKKARGRGRPRLSAEQRDESERRQEIVRAAARLFRERGFAATSTRDIAAAVGLQSGSPFYYFKSKTALLHTVMHDGMERALDALATDASAHQHLRVLVRNHLEVLLGPDSDFIPVMLYEWRSLSAEQHADVAVLKDRYEAQWMPVLAGLHETGALRAHPQVARLLIFGALNWSAKWFRPGGELSLDELTDQALLLFAGED